VNRREAAAAAARETEVLPRFGKGSLLDLALASGSFDAELAGVLQDEFAIACLMTIELKVRLVRA
jgi:hypothetical protein